MATSPSTDSEAVADFSRRLFGTLDGAVTAAMVHLGDRLGLYRALAEVEAEAAVTSAELAERAGLDERWVREWLHNQATADLVEWAAVGGEDRFWLSPEGVAVMAEARHPAFGIGWFHHLPKTITLVDRLPDAFRTGLGYDYDAGGPETAIGMERSFEPWFGTFLVPTVLPLLADGRVAERLRDGGSAADVGCGTGSAVRMLAAAFPAATVTGYDTSQAALDRARQRVADDGPANATFADPRTEPLATDGSLDLVMTIDCLHDMTRPDRMAAAIADALSPDGAWLLVDIKARDGFAANAEENPMASLMYGISVLTCLSSARSEPDGLGLGTLGLSEPVARQLTSDAGFGRFRRLDVDHPVNAFYEVRR